MVKEDQWSADMACLPYHQVCQKHGVKVYTADIYVCSAEGKALEEALRLHDALLDDGVRAKVSTYMWILPAEWSHGTCSTRWHCKGSQAPLKCRVFAVQCTWLSEPGFWVSVHFFVHAG